MNKNPNSNPQVENNASANQPGNAGSNGIVTVNDDKNPTPEERDARIANEPDTARLRSERQSVEEGKKK